MRDTEMVVWTRAGGKPVKMGSLYVTERDARFSYNPDFCDSGLPGLSLIYPTEQYRDTTIVHHQPGALHPRFRALIPPADEQNFQRKLMLAYLRERGIEPATPFEADLALLAHVGHGGIGHVDVFGDDAVAQDWYRRTDNGPLVPLGEGFGFSLREMVSWLDADAKMILESLGPTPTVGGAIPKLLVAIPGDGWDGRISLPTRGTGSDRIDVVLKIERTTAYPGMASLEAMTLDLHRDAGLDVPRYWRAEVGGLPALAIERFDRDRKGDPLPLESVFSILAGGARDIERHYDGSIDRIGRIIDLANPQLVSDRKAARAHLFQRLLLALLSGNGDLHLENLSLIGNAPDARFSPVYDPTPMRAYSMHNMLCAVTFGEYGEAPPAEGEDARATACRELAANLSIQSGDTATLVATVLDATADFPARVEAITDLPEENKRRLQDIHAGIRQRLRPLSA